MRLVPIGDAQLEVSDEGSGEPVVFVQTALTADELVPLARETLARDDYRGIAYHRRGYAGSGGASGPGSIPRDAADCHALLTALGIARAHIVGFSYSGAVGLQLAADAPECTHTLTLLEPPPVHTPSAPEFRAANDRLIESRRVHGPAAALDEFLTEVIGPDWRRDVEHNLPGAAEQMQRDIVTFFDTDLPALFDWRFGSEDARRVGCPVLHIGGTESGPWFAEVRELMLRWFPEADDVLIAGADHSMTLTHTSEIAVALVEFLRHHPMR